MKKVLKYFAKTITYTLLTILIICGLALLFVFVTSKVAKKNNATPPVNLFTIISPSMTPSINVYDVVVAIKTEPAKIKVGDVVTFFSSNPNVNGITVTHRVIQVIQNGTQYNFKTKGDYNPAIDAETITQDKIVGKVYFKIPQLGRVQFFLGSKGGWLIAILIPALAIISYDIYKIIKLIIIKQKIITYQKQDNAPKSEENIGTVTDLYKEEPKVDNSQELINDNYNKESEIKTDLYKEEPNIEEEIRVENYNYNKDPEIDALENEEIINIDETDSLNNDYLDLGNYNNDNEYINEEVDKIDDDYFSYDKTLMNSQIIENEVLNQETEINKEEKNDYLSYYSSREFRNQNYNSEEEETKNNDSN